MKKGRVRRRKGVRVRVNVDKRKKKESNIALSFFIFYFFKKIVEVKREMMDVFKISLSNKLIINYFIPKTTIPLFFHFKNVTHNAFILLYINLLIPINHYETFIVNLLSN